jgi:mRNA interferase RelE/StbE
MQYKIEFQKKASKALKKIPFREHNKILKIIEGLAIQPRPPVAKKLMGRDAWRIRVGNYRIIYEIKDQICLILVLDLGHRREIYRIN